ncbi:VOC family protein [Streptomyces sp. JUS-F4]|uniref:VOC family protein n=1 Tax=Streptomyces sp. JUS-F4 TaxID=2951988 RepID=UPI00266567E0|nr:VOC family protein [Streptomyces sp. JUS-F4]WKN15781.1 VOC family protein [Streptomyces sp. JUS-F4]
MQTANFTACLAVRDVTETLDFYEALGFTVGRESVAQDHPIHLIFNGDTMAFMIQPADSVREFIPQTAAELGASGFFYLNAPDFDGAVARIHEKVEILKEASDGGFRMLYFRDPNGYAMALSAPAV